MGTGSFLYRLVLLLHIGSAIVAFGGMIANGAFNARAFNGLAGPGGVVLGATKVVSRLADIALYLLLPLGIVLIAISDDAFGFGDTWVSVSFIVWLAIVGVTHALVRPAVRTLTDRAQAIPADARLDTDADAVGASRLLMRGEALTQLLLVAALVLMIWKPN